MGAFVHETAIVDDDVEMGDGTKVWHFVHISSGARLGDGCVLGQNVYIGAGVQLGDRVKVQNNVSIYAGVEVGSDVFLGPSCVFTNVINPRATVERKGEFMKTRLGRGATIGANATIVCGLTLGDHAFVGAGAVVTRDVPAHQLVVGNPARAAGWVCTCGEKLSGTGEVACRTCSLRYTIDADGCRGLEPNGQPS